MAKPNPLFEILNSINHNKRDLIAECTYEEKDYNPYIINRFLSGEMDTVIYANEMNIRPFLDKKLQYDFLRGVIRPRKRYVKWLKATPEEHIEAVKAYYNCSSKEARHYLSMNILTPEQLETIYQATSKGGKT